MKNPVLPSPTEAEAEKTLRIISAWPQEERRLKQLAFLLFVCLFQDNNNNNNNNNITNDCLFSFTVNKMIQFIHSFFHSEWKILGFSYHTYHICVDASIISATAAVIDSSKYE